MHLDQQKSTKTGVNTSNEFRVLLAFFSAAVVFMFILFFYCCFIKQRLLKKRSEQLRRHPYVPRKKNNIAAAPKPMTISTTALLHQVKYPKPLYNPRTHDPNKFTALEVHETNYSMGLIHPDRFNPFKT